MSAQRQELEESKLRERALRAQIIEFGKAAEDARLQQRRQPQVVEMPNVEHIQQLATATASAVAAREVMKMDPRQLVQELKDELVGSFAQKMSQLETQSGSSNDATIAAMRASMQRERESTVSEVKQMMQQLQLQLQQHYDDNIVRLSAEAAAREAELVAEANAAKQVAAEAAAAAAAAERTASAAAAAAASASALERGASTFVASRIDQQQHHYGDQMLPELPSSTHVEHVQPQLISAQSLRDASSSSAPHSPESVSSFEGGAGAVVQLPQRKLEDELPQAAAAAAPLHLSSASEVEDGDDDEGSDSAPEEVKSASEDSARARAELAQAPNVAAAPAVAAYAPAPVSPSSSSSSAHTSVTASPDEVKPARVDSAHVTPPPSSRVAHAKLCIDDVLPAQILTMPQGYSGSPIVSRVLITVDEIQQQLQQVETFLSRRHLQATASGSAPAVPRSASSLGASDDQSAGVFARAPAAARASAVLAQDAVSELQRRREQQQQQQPLRGSAQAAPAKVDESARQAELMRSLLLRSGGDDSDGDDVVQPYSSTFGSRQQHLGSERSILDPVSRSTFRASGIGSKSGSGALISDSDSESVEGARVSNALHRQADVPSSPVAKASLSLAASMRTAAVGAKAAVDETSSSDETDESGESDYEEDFDAESGSGSSRQPPVRVRIILHVALRSPRVSFVFSSHRAAGASLAAETFRCSPPRVQFCRRQTTAERRQPRGPRRLDRQRRQRQRRWAAAALSHPLVSSSLCV